MQTVERLIPILADDDIAAAHDVLVNVFGFSSGGVMRDKEGPAVHGDVQVGDAHYAGSPRLRKRTDAGKARPELRPWHSIDTDGTPSQCSIPGSATN
jgi:hypothetical protein